MLLSRRLAASASRARAAHAGHATKYKVIWLLSANTYPSLELLCGDQLEFVWPKGSPHGVALIPSCAPVNHCRQRQIKMNINPKS